MENVGSLEIGSVWLGVAYLDAIRQAVRTAAAAEFATDRIVDSILAVLEEARS